MDFWEVPDSIYRRIEKEIKKEGKLPKEFQLEVGKKSSTLAPPGKYERDLEKYPGYRENCAKTALGSVINVLDRYIKMQEEEALEYFEIFDADVTEIVEHNVPLRNYLKDLDREYPKDKLVSFGYYFARNGRKLASVKLGLTLLSVAYVLKEEEIVHTIKILGYCEEFSYYVFKIVEKWMEKEQQNYYFEMAKALSGYGKITALSKIKADSEEKKQWIFLEGYKCDIMNSPIARYCYEKCDYFQRIENGNLTEEEFEAAVMIMDGLIEFETAEYREDYEEPIRDAEDSEEEMMWGIRFVYEEAVPLAIYYLRELERHPITVRELVHICMFENYFFPDTWENSWRVSEKAYHLKKTVSIEEKIDQSIEEETALCIWLADYCKIDIADKIWELVQKKFSCYYVWSGYLFARSRYIEEMLDLFDKKIDASLYPKRMGNEVYEKSTDDERIDISKLLMYLGEYPSKGKKLIIIALNSPYVTWRSVAISVLYSWCRNRNKPLYEVEVEVYFIVKIIWEIECNENLKNRMRKLL